MRGARQGRAGRVVQNQGSTAANAHRVGARLGGRHDAKSRTEQRIPRRPALPIPHSTLRTPNSKKKTPPGAAYALQVESAHLAWRLPKTIGRLLAILEANSLPHVSNDPF